VRAVLRDGGGFAHGVAGRGARWWARAMVRDRKSGCGVGPFRGSGQPSRAVGRPGDGQHGEFALCLEPINWGWPLFLFRGAKSIGAGPLCP
jgi:hypothetical protein